MTLKVNDVYHVSPSSKGGWEIQKSGTAHANIHASTKVEAIKIGKVISQRSGSTLVIHEKDETSEES